LSATESALPLFIIETKTGYETVSTFIALTPQFLSAARFFLEISSFPQSHKKIFHTSSTLLRFFSEISFSEENMPRPTRQKEQGSTHHLLGLCASIKVIFSTASRQEILHGSHKNMSGKVQV
jgi:hypothetical protein